MTGGFISGVVSLGKALPPPCLLIMVRGPSGARVWQPCFCHMPQGSCGYSVDYQCVNMCEWVSLDHMCQTQSPGAQGLNSRGPHRT